MLSSRASLVIAAVHGNDGRVQAALFVVLKNPPPLDVELMDVTVGGPVGLSVWM